MTGPTGQEVALTSGEFDLLCAFARHPGRVLSRDFLLEETRGREAGPFDRTVDVQIGRLRRKLGGDAESDGTQLIKSVRSAGYILVPPVTASLTAWTSARRPGRRNAARASTSRPSSARCSRRRRMR